jgi:hypothetical protein
MSTVGGPRRRLQSAIAIGGALLLGGIAGFALWAEPIPEVVGPAPVVFVCRNGVAMSVWSAAYFNRLAAAHGLRERAIARAAIPSYSAVPLNMTLALAIDGSSDAPPAGDLAEIPCGRIRRRHRHGVPRGVQRSRTESAGFPPMRSSIPAPGIRRTKRSNVSRGALIADLAARPERAST